MTKTYTIDDLVEMVAQNYGLGHDEAYRLTGRHVIEHIRTHDELSADDVVSVLNAIGVEHTRDTSLDHQLNMVSVAARDVEHLNELLSTATEKRNRHIIAALNCGARRIDVARQALLSPQMIDNIKAKGVVSPDD